MHIELPPELEPFVEQEFATENDPIWKRLCDVVVRQLGVRREILRRETRFVEDLGF